MQLITSFSHPLYRIEQGSFFIKTPDCEFFYGNSVVSKSRHDNALRLFYSLEQIHTIPNVSYLTKVRNTDVLSAHAHGEEEHGDEKEVKKPEAHG